MKRSKSADDYYASVDIWREELQALRAILLEAGLLETIKWGGPCYTHQGKNLVGIGGFKSYFGLWFFQGALLKDPKKVLVNAQEGTTRAMRQWRMHSRDDIDARQIKAYIKEAVQNQQAGREIKAERNKALEIPRELQDALKENPKARAGFEAMTRGKQREYAEHVAGAKRVETRQARLDKALPMIAAGIGLHDKYRR